MSVKPAAESKEDSCECEFIDVLEYGPPMRMAMPDCPQHGHPWDCTGCFYCEPPVMPGPPQ